MKETTVQTQAQYNKIKKDFDGIIRITDTKEWMAIDARPNATIYVFGNATIESVYGNATIESVYGNATIESVYGNATIKSVCGNATIEYVYGNATIKYVYGNATIESVYGNATIESVYGYVAINYVSDKAQVNCFGINTVRYFETEKNIKVKVSKNTTIIVLPRFKPTFGDFKQLYPVTVKGTKAILYKAVHKEADGKYHADYIKSFKYEVGETVKAACSPSTTQSCTKGLHVSHKIWAINFGRWWDDMALIECEVPTKSIVVAEDCDGKVRTSELKVLREVPREEWFE